MRAPTGCDWPHVTDILRDAGLIDTTWFRDYDLARGSALHAATHYLDDGDLDWSSVDPVVLPRLRQYQRFLDEVHPVILAIEEHVKHPTCLYQGTLDRRLLINGREGVLDIKSPTRSDWHGAQLSAYIAPFGRPLARWNLYLSDDRYQLIEQTGRDDWNVFKAALTIANWRGRQGHAR